MSTLKFYLLLSTVLFLITEAHAQITGELESESVNVNGIVVTSDSLKPIPFATISINKQLRGTFSNNSGYFSFIAYPSDTIQFSAVGFKTDSYVLPEVMEGSSYSIIEVLVRDTVLLEEVVVYSFPSIEGLTRAFMEVDLPKKEVNRTIKTHQNLNKILEEDVIFGKYATYDVNDGYTRLYNTGLVPPNNLLNPITWSTFIEDIKKKKKLDRR